MRLGLRVALARLRYIAGVPSGVVLAAVTTFYLLVNAATYWAAAAAGSLGVGLTCVVGLAATAYALHRWRRRFEPALLPAEIGQPGGVRLAARRGAVVLVGLDSAEPGTTFTRLLTTARDLEYLALVSTPQAEARGVHRAMIGKLMPLSGHALPSGRVRVWDANGAESLADVEQSVGEAIAWMGRHGLHPSEIVVDVTKGRRFMHFGALVAADRAQVEVQYLAAEWHHLANLPRTGRAGFTVVRERWDGVGPEAQPLL